MALGTMTRPLNLTGLSLGKLTVISRAESDRRGQSRWLCRCECGTEKIINGKSLRRGETTSCGCWRREINRQLHTTHGEGERANESKEWRTWQGMIRRCEARSFKDYAEYGGRGIKVCAEWRRDFQAFLAHVGRAPSPRHSIDRWPDNDGDYAPGNVRWATPAEQRANQRPRRYKQAIALVCLMVLMVRPAPAEAWTCARGQLFRVHLGQCVDLHSRLALAYIKPVATRREPPAIAPDPPPPERPIPLPELERPAELPAFVLPPVEWPN